MHTIEHFSYICVPTNVAACWQPPKLACNRRQNAVKFYRRLPMHRRVSQAMFMYSKSCWDRELSTRLPPQNNAEPNQTQVFRLTSSAVKSDHNDDVNCGMRSIVELLWVVAMVTIFAVIILTIRTCASGAHSTHQNQSSIHRCANGILPSPAKGLFQWPQ